MRGQGERRRAGRGGRSKGADEEGSSTAREDEGEGIREEQKPMGDDSMRSDPVSTDADGRTSSASTGRTNEPTSLASLSLSVCVCLLGSVVLSLLL